MFAGEIEEVHGIATTDIEVDARGFHVALGDTVTISGGKCDGYTALWPLVFAARLSATYSLDVRNVAESLPMLTAALSFVGTLIVSPKQSRHHRPVRATIDSTT